MWSGHRAEVFRGGDHERFDGPKTYGLLRGFARNERQGVIDPIEPLQICVGGVQKDGVEKTAENGGQCESEPPHNSALAEACAR
jgi:hypothetical protein